MRSAGELSIVETKKIAADMHEMVIEKIDVKVASEIASLQKFSDIIAGEVKTVKSDVAVLPTKIDAVKENVMAIETTQVSRGRKGEREHRDSDK